MPQPERTTDRVRMSVADSICGSLPQPSSHGRPTALLLTVMVGGSTATTPAGLGGTHLITRGVFGGLVTNVVL